MTSVHGFGPVEFTLVVLRRMADYQPLLVEDAARSIGATTTRQRAVNRQWQAMVRSGRFPADDRRYRLVLGPPVGHRELVIGDLRCPAWSWQLPLWPRLRYEVVTGVDGTVWHEGLVRPPGEAAPTLPAPVALAPWSCVVDDVSRAFPGAIAVDPGVPSRWQVLLDRRRVLATFVWGLLQQVQLADEVVS